MEDCRQEDFMIRSVFWEITLDDDEWGADWEEQAVIKGKRATLPRWCGEEVAVLLDVTGRRENGGTCAHSRDIYGLE